MSDDASVHEDHADDHVVARGNGLLVAGRRAIKHARYVLIVDGATPEAESKARDALRLLRSAMDWLEDTERFEAAHEELDHAGRFTRETFGCTFTFENGSYWQECPVALAHVRVGISPAIVIGRVECSICHGDPEDCPHITGRMYEGERCIRNINEIKEFLEVSFVARPAQPDARIMRQSVDTNGLIAFLGAGFEVGMPVNCDRCQSPCDGVSRPFGG